MTIAEAEYLEQRLDDQIIWYDKKSSANQAAYKRLRLIEIIAAATIPLLAGYSHESEVVGMAIGVIGLMVAVLAGIVSLYRFQENWNEYRASAESLKQEKYLYLARAEPYNGDQSFELLVQRVEALLKSETTGWAQAMRATGAADRAERGRAGDITGKRAIGSEPSNKPGPAGLTGSPRWQIEQRCWVGRPEGVRHVPQSACRDGR